MAAKLDPRVLDHLEWLGFVQPTGLVVSAPALVRAGAILRRSDREGQQLLRSCVEGDGEEFGADPVVADFRLLAERVLGWSFAENGYAGTEQAPIPPELEVALEDYGVTLRPDYAVRERDPAEGEREWQLLVHVLDPGTDLDRVSGSDGAVETSPHSRMERLLRETRVPAGLIMSGTSLRLISAPRGESSGWLDFQVGEMVQTAGRPIASAMRLLLSERRLLALPRSQRLAALLKDSRRFQNEVSEKLAEQVLQALYELLRGLQAADDAAKGELLRNPLGRRPDEVYHALLTVLLRLVFLLYAEEREMLPREDVFEQHYSVTGLHDRLREDLAQHPDTIDDRYGAWAQLLVLFRMIHDGAEAGEVELPKRHGVLFDPDRFPFLEGRSGAGSRQADERIEPPLVPDGTVARVLDKLLVLDGERLSYRALDVEQIGSVYETMMGFRLEVATGRAIAIRSPKSHGAPTTVDLEQLLEQPPSGRSKWLKERTDRKLTARVSKPVKEAESVEDLHAALAPVVDTAATPDLVPPGAMVLQPSEERRRSGSHYTPRELTEPIVRTTLAPILERIAEERSAGEGGGSGPATPTPERILELKVCDPAMGSGAFLVEACRQLGEALVDAWRIHGGRPEIPPDEDEVVLARRMVAQRCLYGVDRNPVAVDLAKMSLWLVTLARDHAFTFLAHALRHGDSLVGLTRRQIEAFHWDPKERGFEAIRIGEHLDRVSELRERIRCAGEDEEEWVLHDVWDEAQAELSTVRLLGDLVPAAFFSGAKKKEREAKRLELADAARKGEAERYRGWIEELREAEQPLVPFHWEVEFPEVFDRERPGFDAIVGNPPFMGGSKISAALGRPYLDWLLTVRPESHGNGDLVAHFFRTSFGVLRDGGTLGLIATNTIGQGDTRSTGLRWICANGGRIYAARRRVKWPGRAAVVVSVVHVARGEFPRLLNLDGREVDVITAFLFHRGGNDEPMPLAANVGLSFTGAKIYGQGFTFDDTDTDGVASSLGDMRRLIREDPANGDAVFPYIGGQEVNNSPVQEHHRYVINFGDLDEAECRRRWPKLMAIVEERVRPARRRDNRASYRTYWWQYGEKRVKLTQALRHQAKVLVTNCGATPHLALAFQPSNRVFAHSLAVFPLETHAAFCALQARPHEVWARFFGSSMKDDLRYTPSDCFETFPFPEGWESDPRLEAAGEAYYHHRAELMVASDDGLTKTYNRFHDPEERDERILELRRLHEEMDRAVLAAYGWDDVPTDCEFILDYEVEEDASSRRRKPYRYRWPDEVRDDVLARLIELNGKRAAAERRAGAEAGSRAAVDQDAPAAAGTDEEGALF